MKRRNGFTLVELLAVIVVIALISLLAMPPLVNQLSKTKTDSKNAGFELIYLAASQYLEDNKNLNRELCSNINNCSPDVYCVTLGSMVNDGKLKAPIKNTVTGSQYKLTDAVRVSYYGPGKYRYEFVTDGSCSTVPTYIVDKVGWSVTKNITINYPKLTGTVTKDYSIDGGNKWHTYDNPVTFNSNGTIIGRISNESKEIRGDKLTINKIDSTAPTSSVASIVNSVGELVVKATGKDPESEVARYQYSSDNGENWSSVTSKDTYTFNNLALNKDYKVKVRTINSTYIEESKYGSGLIAGKNYLDSAAKDVKLTDVTEPTYLLTPMNGWSKSKTLKILYPRGYKNEYSLDNGSTWNPYEKELIFKDVATVIARIKDDNNNVTLGEKLNIDTIDKTAPTAADFTATATTSKIKIEATATDEESGIYGYQYSKDGGVSWTDVTTSSTYTFTNLGTGNYDIRVRAINGTYENDGLSDNYRDSSVKPISTKNLVEPTYTIEPAEDWSQTKKITIDYHFTDSDYTYEYSLDNGQSWSRYTAPFTIDKPSTVIARVSDGTNYLTGSAQTVTMIDPTPPENVEVDYDTTSKSITLKANSVDVESDIYGYQFSIDNGKTWTHIQSENEYTYDNISAGNYQVKVRAINNTYKYDGLNSKSYVESSPKTVSTIEIGAIEYVIEPQGWSHSKEVTINYPEGYTNEYSLDGGITWETYDDSFTVDHNLTILSRVSDGYNYVLGQSQTISTIDLSKPDYVDFSYTVNDGEITVIADAADNNSGIYGYQFSLNNGESWTAVKESNIYTFTGADKEGADNTDGEEGQTNENQTGNGTTDEKLDEDVIYQIKVRAINNTYVNEDVTEDNYLDSDVKYVALSDYALPKFDIKPKGWSTEKQVYFEEEDDRDTEYSLDGGKTWNSTECVPQEGQDTCDGIVIKECPKKGCKFIVRATVEGTYITSSTYTITSIDPTPPEDLTVDTIVKGNSIVATAEARDDESGIYGYQFSIRTKKESDEDETNEDKEWTDIQTSPTYKFDNLEPGTYTIDVRAINNTYENEKELVEGGEEEALSGTSTSASVDVKVGGCQVDDTVTEFGYKAASGQEFTPQCDGQYKIELWGAQGGSETGESGGKGGYTSGIIDLTTEDKLYVYVGESVNSHADRLSFNGGGRGSESTKENSHNGNGGGATDVRLVNGEWDDLESLKSRIMVAGGGGGAAYWASTVRGLVGGAGGSLTGQGGTHKPDDKTLNNSTGGTQTSGGTNVNGGTGSFGIGASSDAYSSNWIYQPGGGGGYFGGGKGGASSGVVGSAAGGSSYISGYTGAVAITSDDSITPKPGCTDGTSDPTCSYHYSGKIFNSPIMANGNQTMPTHNGTSTMTGNTGSGYAKITYLGNENNTYEYWYANKEQMFETPITGYYKIEAWGAQGGATKTNVDGTGNTVEGGKGAYTSGIVKLNSGDQLYLNVGAKGIDGRKSTTAPASFNGGGTGGSGYQGGGAGGGASDVRLISKAENNSKSLASRIMVAAGGGGASNYYNPVSGGYGGTLIGDGGKLNSNSVSHTLAGGGTQTAGGNAANESHPGSFGYGGNSQSGHGGGGGAGYYGGGGGGVISSGVSSAAGGSSYISGYKGSVAITSETNLTPKLGCDNGTNDVDCSYHYSGIKFNQPIMKAGNQSMPATSGSSTTVGHSGDGKIKITYLGLNPEFNYDSINDYQTFISNDDSRYKVELWGAAGGSSIVDGGSRPIEREMQTVGYAPAGKGAYTTGVISLNKNDKLHLYVGGKGADAKVKTKSAGGYNGGGLGNDDENDDESDGAGGGATDVRLTPGTWYDKNSLGSRIMVAAGGGGAHDTLRGRNGGALTSESTDNVEGATQTSGNAFGIGQDGSLVSANLPSAGGGGGYFGGHSGKTSDFVNVGTGGSSYISGYHGAVAVRSATSTIPKAGCSAGVLKSNCSYHYSGMVFTATDMKSGSDTMPTYTGTSTMSGNNSGGHVKITLLGDVTTDDETDGTDGNDENDETEIIEDSNVSSYAYTGREEVFTAKKSGKYRIEAWGASGGNYLKFAGGNGGYSTGYVTLTEGSKLYINVGGKGKSTTEEKGDLDGKAGGYNGGGKSGDGSNDWSAGASGGGATHVATTPGLLSSLSSDRYSILIVAGGGGGASKHSTAGNAGGFTGGSATSYGGATIQGGTQTTGYAFGQGQSITNQKNGSSWGAEGNGGAGGGFFGGYVYNENGANSDAGGAGGSGYIGSTRLTDKYMTCYNCSTSNNEDTKTISNNRVSESPVSDYSKIGDGYVKITYIPTETNKTSYAYTGKEEVFTAKKSGKYRIEAWGAQGGNHYDVAGGTGGYSTGYVTLTEGSKLYINVGGKGKSTTNGNNDLTAKPGGYNGGGTSGNGSTAKTDGVKWSAGGGGGGATHVATTSGLLSSLSSYRSSILIVAGGGGGASNHTTPGSGGGFKGGSATSYGGVTISGGTQTTGYAFGQGQSITNQKAGGSWGAEGNGGAGGGFYGGYVHNVIGDNSDAGGAGGSGYIGSTRLTTKHMTCNDCEESGSDSTKTVSTPNKSEAPVSDYAKLGDGYVKITYVEEETDTTPDQEAEYDYTGGQQTFTAAKKGYYKLEAWGASGGDYLSFAGGAGGYSTGYVSLDAGNELYVNVGGQGKSTTQEQNDLAGKAGGYNGGGKSGNGGSNGWSAGASGGGATHIATTSGLLSSLSSNRSSILIVAGGGGGASKHSTSGNGGGFKGGSATSYGGATITGGTQTTGYAFGQGQSITNQKNVGGYGGEGNGGAGGGFYGGYVHNVTGENSDAGGAGGSGYIGNTRLIDKYMACYKCSTSDDEDTRTISSNRVSDRPITSYAKRGNGYVRIIYIGEELNEPGETVTGTTEFNDEPIEVDDGPTKVDAGASDTHKGIVYLDPTDLTKTCNKSNSVSTTETKTGCMKWYIFDDSGDNYKMILDHNTTPRIKWNNSNSNVAYESSNLKPVVDDLVTTSKWKVTPRLITTDEINKITGKTGFDASSYGWYYFDTLTGTTPTFSDSVRSKYDWLYNNLYKCKTDDIDYGCTIESSGPAAFGYWTSTPFGTAGSGDDVWIVNRTGELFIRSSENDFDGIRPVITIAKSKIS